jgi:hypothetical protein
MNDDHVSLQNSYKESKKMKDKLRALASILRTAGYDEAAEIVEGEAKKSKTMKIKVDPLTLAVSLGLLSPSVLEGLEEEGHSEDLSEFDQLLDEVQMNSENPKIP